jgi:hypothetical protein
MKECEGIGSIQHPTVEPFLPIFYVVSLILVLAQVFFCFKRITPLLDFSILFPEIEAPKKSFFTAPKWKRFLHVFGETAPIFLYLAIVFYVFNPSIPQIKILAFSFIPLILYYILNALSLLYTTQNLSNVPPEWKGE